MNKFWGIFVFALSFVSSVYAASLAVLTEDDMISAIKKEFAEEGVDTPMELELFGGKTSYSFENVQKLKVMVSHLKYDEEQNKFSATAEIFADGVAKDKTILNGRYYLLQNVWVPAEDIEKGTVLTADMLKTISVRENRIKSSHVTELEKLVGSEVKKTMKAGKMFTDRDIGQVILIKKGKIVTAVYKAKGLQITTKAEALEDGAAGQMIGMTNLKSGKKFQARVTGAETVEIQE